MPESMGTRGRPVAAALLAAAAAAVVWLPYQLPLPRGGVVVAIHIALPSALVMASFGFAAWSFLPPDQAASVAAATYVAVGFGLSVLEVAYIGAGRGGASLLGMAIWPSLVLIALGRWMGWVPLPE